MVGNKTALLIDGNSLMYRAFYATFAQSVMTNKEGLTTNAIYSFYNMIYRLELSKYDYVFIAYDKGKKTKRHELLPSYKDGRKQTPSELIEQIPYVKELSRNLGAYVAEMDLIEADDLVGTAARIFEEKGVEVTVLSSDKDLLQLVDKHTTVKLTKKGVSLLEEYNLDNFKELTGIYPNQVPDFKGLTGDASDNLKGITSIGEKTAIKMLDKYDTLENIIKNVEDFSNKQKENIINDQEMGLLCKQIATIDKFVDVEFKIEDLEYHGVNNKLMYELFTKLEFNSVKSRYLSEEEKIDIKEQVKLVVKNNDESSLKDILNLKESYFYIDYEGENYHYAKPISFCISDEKTIYNFDFNDFINKEEVRMYFQENNKICFNNKANLVLLKRFGIDLRNCIYDIMLAAYVVNPDTKDELIDISMKYNSNYYEEEFKTSKKKDLLDLSVEEVPYKKQVYYITNIIEDYKTLKILTEDKLELLKLETKLSYVLASMEIEGVKVDEAWLSEMEVKFNKLLTDVQKDIHILAGEMFNINSPTQVKKILFETLSIPYPEKGVKPEKYSTGIEILKLLTNYEIVNKIIEYRKYNKLITSYIDSFNKHKNNSLIHTIYKQTLTNTGRLSSIEPNMQNMPVKSKESEDIRKIIIPKNDSFLTLDYSQIELRVLASLSEDNIMIEAFNNDDDIHSITAAKITNKELNEVLAEDRRIAKAVNFGIVYGQTDVGLSKELLIDRNTAKDFISEYFKTYPLVKNYLDTLVESAKESGCAKTILDRVRYIPDITSSNFHKLSAAKRIAMNMPIQGSAADIIKIAMVNLYKTLNENNLKSKIVLQIHDELVIDLFNEEKELVTKLAIDAMEQAYELKVKLKVNYAYGNNLAELK